MMNLNINFPQNNAAFGRMQPGYAPMGGHGAPGMGGLGLPGMGGMNQPTITINLQGGEESGKCHGKKKSKRSGGLLGGIKDFLRNIGEAIFGEKDDKKCHKGCRKSSHRPHFGGPSAMAHVMCCNQMLRF